MDKAKSARGTTESSGADLQGPQIVHDSSAEKRSSTGGATSAAATSSGQSVASFRGRVSVRSASVAEGTLSDKEPSHKPSVTTKSVSATQIFSLRSSQQEFDSQKMSLAAQTESFDRLIAEKRAEMRGDKVSFDSATFFTEDSVSMQEGMTFASDPADDKSSTASDNSMAAKRNKNNIFWKK